jgi:two-component system, sensor histidine kinase PdtaS
MASHRNVDFTQHAAANSLALAMTTSSITPLLLLDGDLSVVAASDSFCAAFEIDVAQARGGRFSDLGTGEWDVPQVGALLSAIASGHVGMDAYELDLNRPGREPRRLVLNAHKLDYGDGADVRLLLAITDVTDARASDKLKDDLLREKAVLMQELQHRVANSLQIIASVLMQSARRVQSDETRGYLRDAHNRVMSIAEMQRHLTSSTLGGVTLRTYLADLCRSIGASMIQDNGQISLEVTTDETVVDSHDSVSLGLIVTELVINALKHAFPDQGQGTISVSYMAEGADWTLTVRDDGVGMPVGEGAARVGLGTSIIEALAKQLGATVRVASAKPGTMVSIRHRGSPLLASGENHATQH